MVNLKRRQVLAALAAGAAAVPALGLQAAQRPSMPAPPAGQSASALAKNEDFWREVAGYYDRTEGIVNLEHGYWGKMAKPVQQAYLDATRMVNAQNSYYGRKGYAADAKRAVKVIAESLGAHEDEIVLTRNASEAIHNLIRQYQGLNKGDAVLYADVDYPQFKTTMHWLEESRGVQARLISLPSRATQQDILDLYRLAFDEHPNLKLMLLTHVSNQHGLVIPVAAITAEARQRGIDVICDSAQSWGLLDYKIGNLGVDWAGFNLHKWIGSPVGIGVLYMRRGTLQKVAPYPGETDPDNSKAATRIHTGTANFASILAIPAALEFHQSIGGANKEARLRHLRSLWTDEAQSMQHIEVLGGADEASWTGMGAFRLAGKNSPGDAKDLQQRLENEFGIFTVVRKGLASGHCVRITPQVFSSSQEIASLTAAMKRLRA